MKYCCVDEVMKWWSDEVMNWWSYNDTFANEYSLDCILQYGLAGDSYSNESEEAEEEWKERER